LINVKRYPPPANYNVKVKNKGQKFLNSNPNPTASEFKRHAYWKEIHKYMHNSYSGICAYCASWTPKNSMSNTDHTSIDHFIPKSKLPSMAYEWDNFRLCRIKLNVNKSDSLDVMDPLFIRNGWFIIDFTSFLIRPSSEEPAWIQGQVNASINRLQLNVNEYVNERRRIIFMYACDRITLVNVKERYPFIASEIQRQDFDKNYKIRIRTYCRKHALGIKP